MLPKSQRLTSNRIEYLLRKGRRSTEGGRKNGNLFFTVKYLTTQQPQSRFCVIVSTKIFPKAVERNHLRRQIYEVFRLHPELPSFSADIVVIAKTPLTKLNFQDLTKTIVQLLKNITKTS